LKSICYILSGKFVFARNPNLKLERATEDAK
jgi:hypothetical protein